MKIIIEGDSASVSRAAKLLRSVRGIHISEVDQEQSLELDATPKKKPGRKKKV